MQTQERIIKSLDEDRLDKQTQKDKKQEKDYVGFFELYRFAQRSDYILIFLGIVFAGVFGCGSPFFAYIWGKMTDVFVIRGDTLFQKASQNRNIFLYIGTGALFAGWISFSCWIIVGERMAIRCRKAYLNSLLKQQIGYFDVTSQYTLSSQFQNDTLIYQRAIGEKVGSLLYIFSMFTCGAVIAFSERWLLAIVLFGALPFLGITGFLYIYLIQLKNTKFLKIYEKSGSRAQQVITAIKTVKQLNGQEYQFNLYNKSIQKISQKVFKYALYAGIGSGLFFLSQFCAYALGFWFGSHCAEGSKVCSTSVTGSRYTAGQVMIVFFAIFVGTYNFMQLVPSLQKIFSGMKAAYRIYKVIDRAPIIQNSDGKIIQNFKGIIKFENVHFSYPKDKSLKVLKGLTATLRANEMISQQITYQNQSFTSSDFCCSEQGDIKKSNTKSKGKTNSIAFVGESGCGKSTVLQLIMRFYDPDQGRITLDGVDLKQLDLRWLRTQIGYVGQEPVLFNTTIKQNIRYGKPNATDEQIRQALIKAQALDFVQALQQKLETNVGYGGGHLSGGQKQRIAIARAIIKDPKILILDQATSALDRKNQKLIQGTLDKVAQGRTSITVAHRVKTIMNCNKIFVLSKGKLLESGSFNKLKRYKQYTNLQKQEQAAQQIQQKQLKKLTKLQNIRIILEQKNNKILYNDFNGLSKQLIIQKQEQIIRQKYSKGVYKRLFSYTDGNRIKFFLGVISSVVGGAAYPIFTIFMAKLIVAIYQLSLTTEYIYSSSFIASRDSANRNSLFIMIIGIIAFFAHLFEMLFFSLVGEKVTQKLRLQSFHKVLRMPITWFELPRNSGSAVANRMAVDAQLVNGLTTLLFAIIIKNLTTILVSFVIAFIYEWRIGLVGLICMPLMFLAGFISMLFYGGYGDMSQKIYSNSAALISESIMSIRTVQAFLYQNIISQKYGTMLEQISKFGVKKGIIIGILYGLCQFLVFVSFSIIFWIGSIILRDNGSVSVENVFVAIFAIVWAGWTAGNNFFFLPDVGAGKRGAARLFQLIDNKDEQQSQIMQQSKFLKSGITGEIVLKDVAFRYNSRNQYVFKNISISIKQGQKIAFVGPSGCGKSTIIQLLLRFYMQNKGTITLGGQDIKDYDLNYLRSCFGVVGQEPVLFNGTFRQNIRYNNENASDQDIAKAAQKAKALTFITGQQNSEDPESKEYDSQRTNQGQNQKNTYLNQGKGFDRNVGIRGSHISGGQKQRVAIARAILKQPKLLLLDEATSALDSKNQKLVQDSLDHIMIGKTTITIAHRIDTIKNSDRIFVFDKGEIVQSGTYKQLINKKGYFYRLERGINFV